jgi:DNA-3-methyladenine glycosylase II
MAKTRRKRDPWKPAIEHLRRVDPHCATLIDRVGPCQLEPRPDRFSTLVRAIIGQQISTKAAASIDTRLRTLGGDPHHHDRLIELGEDGLRSVGLSSGKARYVLNLSEAVQSNAAPLHEFDGWSDEEIVACLTAIKGIGVWTAEMFLIFALNRPDVLPVGDLGLRAALRDRLGLSELPGAKQCRELAEPWRPYRTIATWYLWRGLDTPNPETTTPP